MTFLKDHELREFLEEKAFQYNSPEFIDSDPVQLPHLFSDPNDIEISAFLTASIAWGNRKSIIQNAKALMTLMDNSPHDFIMNAEGKDMRIFSNFVHRTFRGDDCVFFIQSLQNIYREQGGLGGVFQSAFSQTNSLERSLIEFRELFFRPPHPARTQKHVSDITKSSAAKRLNLFLRWMVRRDKTGIDFGLWKGIPMSALFLPLDVHTASVARKLGLLKLRQNNWKAVLEVTEKLREFDRKDPVKYDYALFGLGIFEKF
jgi:uncharacterized protein (TIGR02757 family)